MAKPPEKWKRVLAALLTGRSFTRFQAEKPVHEGGLSDHCLHSTISEIQGRGVRVSRKAEKVGGFQGIPTRLMRYWLDLSDVANTARARALVDGLPAQNQAEADRWQRVAETEARERRDRAQRVTS